MFITPSFKKSLIVEQFQGNYLKHWSPREGSIKLYDSFAARKELGENSQQHNAAETCGFSQKKGTWFAPIDQLIITVTIPSNVIGA